MCGIAGIVDFRSRLISSQILAEMTNALQHRGPDAEGFWQRSASPAVGLGHRRLSVIDLGTGGQPMSTPDGALQIIFNGEIYNYRELRQDLLQAGYTFRSESDTEVILRAYEAYGPECLNLFVGMFAFAIWDERKQQLFAARDRLGKKPFIYQAQDERLIFASEINAVLQHPEVTREIDATALHHYLSYGHVPYPWTAFKNIRKLPPAHYLIYRQDKLSIQRYWHLDFSRKQKIDLPEAIAHLGELLEDAVRLRLRSDVPLGVFLSGGMDSSSVLAIASRLNPRRLKTFSIGFSEARYNELPFAQEVAQRFATEHHQKIVQPEAISVISHLVSHYGEPFADSSALPTYHLAKMAREQVTVVLNGDGGDEALGGYYRHLAMRWADRYQSLPGWVRGPLGRIFSSAGRFPAERGFGRPTIRRFLKSAGLPRAARWSQWTGFFSEEEKRWLYTTDMQRQTQDRNSLEILEALFDETQELEGVDAALAVDTRFYLPNDLLVKMDIATMAFGLEARSPLLDHRILEFTASLPADFKVRGTTTKYLLKTLQQKLLPPAITSRPKKGFSIPISEWLRGPLKPWLSETLLSPSAKITRFIQPHRLRDLVTHHIQGTADYGHPLWLLLMLELWLQPLKQPIAMDSA